MDEVQQWINDNTFFCCVYRAKISVNQCRGQCIKVFQKMMDDHMLSGIYSDDGTECMTCDNWYHPTKDDIAKLEESRTKRRYPDSVAGEVTRKIMVYVQSCQEKLYDEERKEQLRYRLSRSSSVTKPVP